jgi:putative membrane protein (TIGR04086 family)
MHSQPDCTGKEGWISRRKANASRTESTNRYCRLPDGLKCSIFNGFDSPDGIFAEHRARILLGGLLAEVALILAIVPLGLRFGDNFLHYTAPPGSFVMCFLGALWVCRRIESHFILHGTLVGVVAALIYVGLTRAQPEPFAYILAHALKLVGGACGGFVAQRRRSLSPAQPVHD